MRIRHVRLQVTSSSRIVAVVGCISACGIAAVLTVQLSERAAEAGDDATSSTATLLGTTSVPGVIDLERELTDTLEAAARAEAVPSNLRPSLPDARLSVSEIYGNGCHVPIPGVEPVVCEYGDVDGDIVAVIIGDSHAGHWLPALDLLADRSGILLLPLTKSGCSVADVPLFSPMLDREYTECAEWRGRMLALVADIRPDIVITSQASSYTLADLPEDQWADALQTGYAATLDRLSEHAGELIVLGDTPYAARDIPNCLWENLRNVTACVRSRTDSFSRRLTVVELAAASEAGARYVQADDLFCGPTMCPVIVGDILVYRDVTHITTTFMTWVAPALGELLGRPWDAGPTVDHGPSSTAPS